MKNRLYSIPYNTDVPSVYINNVMKRKKYIDHVFLEFPFYNMRSHNTFMFGGDSNAYFDGLNRATYLGKCIKFLQMSKGKFRRICTLNSAYYNFKDSKELDAFLNNIFSIVNEFAIDGLIMTEYRLAYLIHKVMPKLEIHTSCNCFSWNVRQMQLWKENCGVKIFNPPREILRKPSVLKEMAEAGFKLKCIVNESCLMGCPNTVTHAVANSMNGRLFNSCIQSGPGDIFRGNWILPRWQKYYDEYVYIYKIAGRGVSGDYPFRCLDWYINEVDNIPLTELVIGGTRASFGNVIPKEYSDKLTLDKVHDKLRYCECKECAKCGLCEATVRKFIPEKYFDMRVWGADSASNFLKDSKWE